MKPKLKRAAVIGSGVMGGGIAALLASTGISTLLLDILPPDLADADAKDPKERNRIAAGGLNAVKTAQPALLMSPTDVDRIAIGNLTDDFDRLADCDWIIEVVVENLKIKQELFARIDAVRRPGTVVSSNTSGIPLKQMSQGLSDDFRKHFLGTHFFNPVRYMKLLEIIPGEDTLPEVLDALSVFGERRLGKGIVAAKDTPNFVGNRIGVQGMVNSMRLMADFELTIPDVDALFGPVLGRPKTGMFKTADLVGLDTLVHVANNTRDLVVNDEARDSFTMPAFVNDMVEKGLLGKKSGSGFYKTELTPEWKKIRKVLNPATLEYAEYEKPAFPCLDAAKAAKGLPAKMKAVVYGDDPGAKFAWAALGQNLIYAANRIPEIADSIVEIDNAMKWGFNFTFGPFETWDAIGVAESVARMRDDGMTIPAWIDGMLAAGNDRFYKTEGDQILFYDPASGAYQALQQSAQALMLAPLKSAGRAVKTCKSASLVDIGDDVFCLEFHTKMNALNGEIVEFMSEGLDFVETNGVGLVIGNQAGGMPGAFSAGGDLAYMAELAKAEKYDAIDAFIRTAQDGMQRARYASIPVVAAPYGMTLGGGCEVCLGAADRIVAHTELYMGLVEIGVGLLPAGGGCLNLWRKMTADVPAVITDVDWKKFFIPTFMSIAMAKVSMSAAEARANGFLGPQDRIVFNRDHLIGEAKQEVLRMVEDGYAPPVKRPIRVVGDGAQGMIAAELYNMGKGLFVSEYDAFLAQRIAYVISGGDVRDGSLIDEQTILNLEREAFVDFWKQEKSRARVEHMLTTGKPLRN